MIRTLVLCGVLLATPVAPASAAQAIGEIFTGGTGLCSGGYTYLETTSPGNTYVVPSAGVITSWSHQGTSPPPQMRLKVARGTAPNYEIVGHSELKPLSEGLNSFQTRISVTAGDAIGLYITTNGDCVRAKEGYGFHSFLGDPGIGDAKTFTAGSATLQFNIAAKLEPDADNDGYGDETQDQCPTDASTQGQCPGGGGADTDPPQTVITKDPPNRSDKGKVTYKFTSNEEGSDFECKLDKEGWSGCNSPEKVRVDDGKHKFKVRAIDAAGNVDPSPDKDKFKIVG